MEKKLNAQKNLLEDAVITILGKQEDKPKKTAERKKKQSEVAESTQKG